ncbi:MAG: non-homologous end-joining DNA ligase [Sciscionella sp.]
MPDERVTVAVGDRRLRLSNLDKVLYPTVGFTKGEVIDYYAAIAPILLPHLHGRPVTLRRYPDGVVGESFFEKDVSRHAPQWVPTVRVETPGSSKGNESANFVRVEDLPTLVWVANLAALELHVPQWTVGPRGGKRKPDLLVFDLDPGPGTSIVECAALAVLIRDRLAEDGLAAYPKTSGSKGMQLYSPVTVSDAGQTSKYARRIAEELARQRPREVVATMATAARRGKVLIDWSQNNPAKTTVAAYSLRGRDEPTVSTPLTWDEVELCSAPQNLVFTAQDVRHRMDTDGDLFADLHDKPVRLPG